MKFTNPTDGKLIIIACKVEENRDALYSGKRVMGTKKIWKCSLVKDRSLNRLWKQEVLRQHPSPSGPEIETFSSVLVFVIQKVLACFVKPPPGPSGSLSLRQGIQEGP